MALNAGLELITGNLGIGFPDIILLVVILGGLVFYAKDFRLGLIIHFIFSGLIFMWCYGMSWNYAPSLIFMLVCLVGLTLTLFASAGAGKQGVS